MAEKSKETGKIRSEAPESAAPPPGRDSDKALESLNWLGAVWLENWGAVGSEVSHFVAERVREDIKTQQQMLNCKNPGELQAVQAKFIQTAIDQYTTETGKLVEMGQEFAEKLTKTRPS